MSFDFEYDEELAKESGKSFDPIPDGDYKLRIVDCQDKPTKNGAGKMLEFRLTVHGPSHVGRVIFERVIYKHTSKEAEKIGRAKINEIMAATGVQRFRKPEDVIGKAVIGKVRTEPGSNGYEPRNKIVKYSPIGSIFGSQGEEKPAASEEPQKSPEKPAPPWLQFQNS